MGEGAREVQLHIMSHQEDRDKNPTHNIKSSLHETKPTNSMKPKSWKWYIKLAIYSLCVLAGQAVATLLGRLYFDKGGQSKWLATLVQLVGFPIVFPLYFILIPINNNISTNNDGYNNNNGHNITTITKSPTLSKLAFWYITLGLFMAADCYLYSIGLMYLPVSTYSLICASQLAFNALFSFFLNAQKFTPYIVNSLVLLTISSALLVFQSDSKDPNEISKGKYVIGFVSTVGASAGYALGLSLTQLFFAKVIKKKSFRAVIDMIAFESIVASCVAVIALFGSGEWAGLSREMTNYELGKVLYVMNLLGTAISWAVFGVGCVGLISDVSALFSDSVSVVGLPIVPILAVVCFNDKMDGVKVIAMLLAIWGFLSFVYQHYLDGSKLKRITTILADGESDKASSVGRG